MPLSCSCDFDYEPEFGQIQINFWKQDHNIDFEPLKTTKRKRCASCNVLIDIGSQSVEFPMVRYPRNEIEARIKGLSEDPYDWEEAQIEAPSVYLCESCGEIYFNLESVGFECVSPFENMPDLLSDYQVEYAPPKLPA